MKKLILLLALLPMMIVAQTKSTYSCPAVYFVDSVTNVKRSTVFDYKIQIDFKTNQISIVGQKAVDTFPFHNMQEKDYDKTGKKLFFEISEGQYYKVMMLWYTKGGWQILFKPEDPKVDVAYFRDCTKI